MSDVNHKADKFSMDRRGSHSSVIEHIEEEIHAGFRAGAAWKAEDILGRLQILKANTRNMNLTNANFRELATEIIDDLVRDLGK